MHSNYFSNCCCCSSFCNCRELAGIPNSACCPPSCCCCPICRSNNRRSLKMSMYTKPKPTNATAAALKNTSKSKPKTIKTKKVTRNEKPGNQTHKRNSLQERDGSSLKSDKPMGIDHSLHTSSSSLKTINSPRLETSASKQKLNLNIPLSKAQEESYTVFSERSQGSHLSHSSGSKRSERAPSLIAKTPMGGLSSKDKAFARLCSCCYKPAPMYSSSPNSSRHSFSSPKSHSQLDVITEVDSDAENNRRQCSSVDDYAALDNFSDAKASLEKTQRRSTPPSQAHKTNLIGARKKSLEDSCADFLNIVCDNVTESVQKSIDCKLQEFITQATEKFTRFTQQLAENGAAMQNLLQEQAEKMAERHKRDFEEFYLRIQDLLVKQLQTRCSETYDTENQLVEQQPEQQEAEASNIPKELINNIENTFVAQGNVLKCEGCHCCFEEENVCHLCSPEEINEINRVREAAGGQATQSVNNKGEVKQCNSCTENFSKPVKQSSHEFCAPQKSPSAPNTLTNLCPTTSGKINCFCNLSTRSHDWVGNKMKACEANNVNGACNNKLNSPLVCDNYDTSGYATEPEDNSEGTINGVRKKLQRKSFKQHNLKRQISLANNLEPPDDAHDALDDDNERSSFQATKRLSRSSLKSRSSSPTRLSRL